MKYLLIVLLLKYTTSIIVSLGNDCDCAQLTYDKDCDSFCDWNPSTQECSNPSCGKIRDPYICAFVDKCAWTNSGVCADFTKCTDYKVSNYHSCYFIKSETECQGEPIQSGSQYICQPTQPLDCTMFLTEDTCKGFHRTAICAWKSGASTPSCVVLSFDTCSNFNQFSSLYCPLNYCNYDSATMICSDKACSDLPAENCTYVPILPWKSYRPCKLSGDLCVEASDMSHLSDANCLVISFLQYHWDPDTSQCTSCQDSSAHFVVANIVYYSPQGHFEEQTIEQYNITQSHSNQLSLY